MLALLVACSNDDIVNTEAKEYGEDHTLVTTMCPLLFDLDAAEFNVELRILDNTLGYARVRSHGSFSTKDTSNLLARVLCGAPIKARIPDEFKDTWGEPYYYQIIVEDEKGHTCLGYVSKLVVEKESIYQGRKNCDEFRKANPDLYKFNTGVDYIEGYYFGKNLYVQNPFNCGGTGFCVRHASVNGSVSTDEISSSAFEIDFSRHQLRIGDPIIIKMKHEWSCIPKVLNPEVVDSAYMATILNLDSIYATYHVNR